MRYKTIISFVLVLFLVIITACDTTNDLSNNDKENTAEELINFEDANLSFYYPPSIAKAISTETIDERKYHNSMIPEHKKISFDSYLLSDTRQGAYIRLLPVEEYSLLCEFSAEQINLLQEIIKEKDIPDNIVELPFLPPPNAGQQFHSNINFIESKTASGLRYLTQFSQNFGPITNEGILYVYLGITNDQKHYASAVFPINHSELPFDEEEYFEITGTEFLSFNEDYDEYLDSTVQMLDDTSVEDFKPSLLVLDKIIKSFQIE